MYTLGSDTIRAAAEIAPASEDGRSIYIYRSMENDGL